MSEKNGNKEATTTSRISKSFRSLMKFAFNKGSKSGVESASRQTFQNYKMVTIEQIENAEEVVPSTSPVVPPAVPPRTKKRLKKESSNPDTNEVCGEIRERHKNNIDIKDTAVNKQDRDERPFLAEISTTSRKPGITQSNNPATSKLTVESKEYLVSKQNKVEDAKKCENSETSALSNANFKKKSNESLSNTKNENDKETGQTEQSNTNIAINHEQIEVVSSEENKILAETREVLRKIQEQVGKIEESIKNFDSATADSDEYYYFDEALLDCMIKIDHIPTKYINIIREERRHAIKYVQKVMEMLDQKIKENQLKSSTHN